jgi:hypothetical protein
MPTSIHTPSTGASSSRSLRRLLSGLVLALAMAVGLSAVSIAPAQAAGDWTRVAKTSEGVMKSKITGTTDRGGAVRGSFTPVKFVKRNGKVFVKGFLEGVANPDRGATEQFSGMKRLRVRSLNGQSVTNARAAQRAAASCDVLNLDLGPLDLDLLGLQVQLDRVVLKIIAQSGAGNLLGNLVCAVAGLLDGGLSGLLGRVSRLLNRILGALNLGL